MDNTHTLTNTHTLSLSHTHTHTHKHTHKTNSTTNNNTRNRVAILVLWRHHSSQVILLYTGHEDCPLDQVQNWSVRTVSLSDQQHDS